MNIVVIIPTYNEKGNIERLIPLVFDEVLPEIKEHRVDVLVADDSSPDGTAQEVKELMKKYKNLHLLSGKKEGLGAAYVRAMSYAIDEMDADLMFEMDADFFHDPKKIPEFIKKVGEGNDLVIGTRYSGGGSIPKNWGLHRKAFSVIGNLLVRTIVLRFGIHDWTGGFRAIKKEVFLKEKDKLGEFKGYTFQVAFLYKSILDGYKVAEVPFAATDRTAGRSKIAPLEYIINLLKYVIFERVRELLKGSFGKFLIVGGTGFLLQIIVYKILIGTTHLPLGIDNWIAAQLAIFSNYNINNLWTFKERRAKSFGSYLVKMGGFFLTSNIGVILIQSGIIQLGEILYGRTYPMVYFVVGTGLLLFWNFTMYSKVIWRRKR